MAQIDIFLSRPTEIPKKFEAPFAGFEPFLKNRGLRARRLGADEYSLDSPLTGVMDLMTVCQGAIILGYPLYHVTASVSKAAMQEQHVSMVFPTPWNQIEATLAFKDRIPVLVVAHEGVSGGIFDHGVTGQYVLTADLSKRLWYKKKDFLGLLGEWEKRISKL